MTDADRGELRRLCEAASAGPWTVEDYPFSHGAAVYGAPGEFETPVVAELHDENPLADAEFIAAARTALPRLLDALERVERERDAAIRCLDLAVALDAPAAPPETEVTT